MPNYDTHGARTEKTLTRDGRTIDLVADVWGEPPPPLTWAKLLATLPVQLEVLLAIQEELSLIRQLLAESTR